jgi:hypothetical protein
MTHRTTRRRFLKLSATGGMLAGLGGAGVFPRLPAVALAETKVEPAMVQFQPDVEPLVRWLEDTPRERLLEEVGARIRGGLSYRQVLAALLLAGIRNVQPRPSVGFKFHAVLVVNSAHLAALSTSDQQRWLPIFWALDYFKSAQAQDVREGDWTMRPANEAALPPAHKAREAFLAAMDRWDEAAADAAIAAWSRAAGAHEIYEALFRYGARDFRSIGHKAIYVANSYRTLQCIGWRYAEPVLRSLAYAALMHEEGNPAERDADADRPWRRNLERAKKIRPEWLEGKLDHGATTELLAALRQDSPEDVCEHVVALLNRGVAVQSMWDGLLTGAAELLVRQPGIVALHATTTSNALRFAFGVSADDATRRLLLLQNAAFLPLFREAMRGRGKVEDFPLDKLSVGESAAQGTERLEQILADVGRDSGHAAQHVLGYLSQGGDPQALVAAARRLVCTKGDEAHDYKFGSAVFEDCQHLSPRWQPYFLAGSVFKLHGSGERDNPLVERTHAALHSA